MGKYLKSWENGFLRIFQAEFNHESLLRQGTSCDEDRECASDSRPPYRHNPRHMEGRDIAAFAGPQDGREGQQTEEKDPDKAPDNTRRREAKNNARDPEGGKGNTGLPFDGKIPQHRHSKGQP